MLTCVRDLFRLCDSGILLRRRRCLPVGAVAWIANRQAPESFALRASLFDATDNGLIRFPRPSTSERTMAEPTLSETFEEVHIVTSFHCVSQSQVHSVNFLLGLHALGVLAAAFLTGMGVIALPACSVRPSWNRRTILPRQRSIVSLVRGEVHRVARGAVGKRHERPCRVLGIHRITRGQTYDVYFRRAASLHEGRSLRRAQRRQLFAAAESLLIEEEESAVPFCSWTITFFILRLSISTLASPADQGGGAPSRTGGSTLLGGAILSSLCGLSYTDDLLTSSCYRRSHSIWVYI